MRPVRVAWGCVVWWSRTKGLKHKGHQAHKPQCDARHACTPFSINPEPSRNVMMQATHCSLALLLAFAVKAAVQCGYIGRFGRGSTVNNHVVRIVCCGPQNPDMIFVCSCFVGVQHLTVSACLAVQHACVSIICCSLKRRSPLVAVTDHQSKHITRPSCGVDCRCHSDSRVSEKSYGGVAVPAAPHDGPPP